ncbi:hypothetical protein [Vulcanisaeta distributa]|uniref:Uncharacterized protein n=1 Tax=Vulcanisaeta distributa (strain DSM 14429 / JCM 11212 / NBRC 100878 / IC-017) TaxID=572478 RepID=E1QSP3_VULDI|nr:hypothetical protein [Vulcanisaeta distributa]ADN49560.1 hypothetical protein Vdis_0147 [Vulcanisaeta distributa DSM 14429]
MNLDELFSGVVGFIIAMVIMAMAVGGVIYGYYQYVQSQVLANYLWPVVDVVPYEGGYYMAVVNAGHEPFFVKAIFLSDGSHIEVRSNVLYHDQAWFYQASDLPSAVMVCSAIKPSVCVIARASGWSMIDDAPSGSGWVNITLIVDPFSEGSVSWVGVGDNKGVSGSIGLDESNNPYFGGYAVKDIFTYGPLLIEVTYRYYYLAYNNSTTPLECWLETSPGVQPILLSKTEGLNYIQFTYMLIASPNTDLTIHVKCNG